MMLPIIVSARKPHTVTWSSEFRLMGKGVTIMGNGWDCLPNPGWMDRVTEKARRGGRHIIPIQDYNKEWWKEIASQWQEAFGNRYTDFYIFRTDIQDEPRTISEFKRCQEWIDIISAINPYIIPIVSLPLFRETEALYPKGGVRMNGEFVYLLDLHVISLAELKASYVGSTWKHVLDIPSCAEVWGYLARYNENDDPYLPQWYLNALKAKNFSSASRPPTLATSDSASLIGKWCFDHGLEAFYYYAIEHLMDGDSVNNIGKALNVGRVGGVINDRA